MLKHNNWIASNGKREKFNGKVRLFCFPYAGGGMAPFYSWTRLINPGVDLIRVKLPGRDDRLREPPCSDLEELVDILAKVLEPFFDRPFSFFGHSFGALIAFELISKLRDRGIAAPRNLFVSGFHAPHIQEADPIDPYLPEAQFIQKIIRYEGMDEKILQSPELLEIFLPILRADFRILWRYNYIERPPLRCPITAFGGINDKKVVAADIKAWQKHTSATFKYHFFQGGHFYLNAYQEELLSLINQDLIE